MNKKSIKMCLLLITAAGISMAASATNYSYTGNGADPNDWFDTGNWGGVAYPSNSADGALFTTAGVGMTINQVVSELGQFQVGRGVDNTVTIASGGVMTNLNQTVVGIKTSVNGNGRGTLIIDGGSLITARLRSATTATAAANSRIEMKNGLLDINEDAPDSKGDLLIGETAYATFELSGGTVTVDNDISIIRGILNVVGDAGSITTGGSLNFGTIAATTTRLGYELALDRGVTTINADSFSYLAGTTRELIINGDNANAGAVSVTLMSLVTDIFSGAELTELQGILNTSNITDGMLSLANSDKDLVFTGTVIPEPATLGMIALMGGGMLFVRRLMI
jgi:hypothetical protein